MSESPPASSTGTHSQAPPTGTPGWTTRLNPHEALELTRYVAQMASAGLPLPEGLRAAAQEIGRGRLGNALLRLAGRLEGGTDLATALADDALHLPPHLCGLILAGTASGQLVSVLEEYVTHSQRMGSIRRRIWLTISYPSVVLLISLLLAMTLGIYVLPQIATISEEFDTDLPLPTRFMIWLGEYGQLVPISLIVFGVLVTGLAIAARHVPLIQAGFNHIPFVGPLWRCASLASWCRLMGLMTQRHVPLPNAVAWSCDAVQDAQLADGGKQLVAGIESGQSLGTALVGLKTFPSVMQVFVSWAEEARALPEIFRSLAELFESQGRVKLELLRTIFPPLIFAVVCLLAGFLASAVLMPAVQLFQKMASFM